MLRKREIIFLIFYVFSNHIESNILLQMIIFRINRYIIITTVLLFIILNILSPIYIGYKIIPKIFI